MPSLPDPIDIYFSLPTSAPVTDLARAFADQAIVRDEKRVHQGLDAIRDWRIDTIARTPFTARPLSVDEREGTTIVPTEVTGSFPGSPLVLDHRFTLQAGRIVSLEIA
ncbi:nuclear transport factor 2 family protein [Aurantimonas sp. VKM B-3413]|uniref:nuclear transport factor 2 family protein n=1 Tax=Aurantimonas sp. VKM B-3413 TaxID=2779401 RepID=UPI001E52E87F|nr:nuclear transport factor 2 family protein [Aurantimonas sp. VKM B-3413]MCB8839300.1 nuclear transport factor 2 family protein [Aurantimonas sp. VKM B-3413]